MTLFVPDGTQGLPLEECQKLLWTHWFWGRGVQASRPPAQPAGAISAGPGGVTISSHGTAACAGGTRRSSLAVALPPPSAKQRGVRQQTQSAGVMTPYRRSP